MVHPIIPIYLSDKFQLSMTEIGLFFSISQGISGIIGNLSGGLIADRFGRRRLLLICALVIPFLMFLWTLMNLYTGLLAIWMVFWGLRSMMLPSRTAFLMDLIPASTRGLASGITMIGGRVGIGVGMTVGGLLCEIPGLAAPFYGSALLWGLCIPTILLLKEKA